LNDQGTGGRLTIVSDFFLVWNLTEQKLLRNEKFKGTTWKRMELQIRSIDCIMDTDVKMFDKEMEPFVGLVTPYAKTIVCTYVISRDLFTGRRLLVLFVLDDANVYVLTSKLFSFRLRYPFYTSPCAAR
jgi:hypothetical protein